QKVSGRAIDLEEIQDEDTSPSEITSKISMEVKGFEPPQEEVIPIRGSERTYQAPTRLCLNVEVDEHNLGDLNEPTSYKAVMLDLGSNKWIDAMNMEIQSMMDNMVWVLVNLPLGCKTVGKSATRILNMVSTSKRDTPDKLQQRSVKCIFICYPKETMGFYFYFPTENKIVVARYAEFFEKNLITQKVSGRAIDLEEI
nr:zinc finger, CCHC-type [Tanacetum cinerariifolium]